MEMSSPLYDTFQILKDRPALVIGDGGIESLFHFVQGWYGHRYFFPDQDTFVDFFKEGFHDFTADALEGNSSEGWGSVIAQQTDDRGKQLEIFLELLDKFIIKNEQYLYRRNL